MLIPFLEPLPSHLVYTFLSLFLILYALFSDLIRNRLHLSEPPLASLLGMISGGLVGDFFDNSTWRFQDNVTQEITRVIVGIQVFSVGLELPAGYVKKKWKSLSLLLGPVMIAGWFISAAIVWWVLRVKFSTALVVAACLTPTDPVLSASVLGEARFSQRIPGRLRHILSAESGCNDGSAFPFLYAAVFAITKATAAEAVKSWFIEVILWQCMLGILVGGTIGYVANRALRFSEVRGYVQEPTLFAFYFLLAMFSIGVGSTLGMDDFLVSFSSGAAFCWDGWFAKRTHKMKLPSIIDLIFNSAMFVYFGTIIPWDRYHDNLSPGRMVGCTILILLFRRLPAIVALKRFIPDIRTWSEAFFAGHFGPIGVGALFLAIEARARLETGSSVPLPHPPKHAKYQETIDIVWPAICFVVLGSIFIHGFSALVMSIVSHLTRHPDERAPMLGGETQRLYGMASSDAGLTDSEEEDPLYNANTSSTT